MKKSSVYILIGLVLVVGLFVLLKPKNADNLGIINSEMLEMIFEIKVAQGKVILPSLPMKAQEGDNITLKIRVDTDEELHLHGYDLSLELKKNTEGELKFTANMAGRFEMELHPAHLSLGVIEVSPK